MTEDSDAESLALRALAARVDRIKVRWALPGVVLSVALGMTLAVLVGTYRITFALAFVAGFAAGVLGTVALMNRHLRERVPVWLLKIAREHGVPAQEMLVAVDVMLPSLHVGSALAGALEDAARDMVGTPRHE